MTIRKITLFTTLILFVYSCSKEVDRLQNSKLDVTKNPNAIVYGNVAFLAEGKTKLEGAKLELYGIKNYNTFEYLTSTSTNEEGYYEFNYNADFYDQYSIRIKDDDLDRAYSSEECVKLQVTNLECGHIINSSNTKADYNFFKVLNIQLNIIDSSQNSDISFGSLNANQYCQCIRLNADGGLSMAEGVIEGDFSMMLGIPPPIKFEWTIKNQDGSYSSYEKVLHQTNDQCEDQELTIKY